MRRLTAVISLDLVGESRAGCAANPALTAGLLVPNGPGCFPAIPAAFNVAHDEDSVRIRAGIFVGGGTITKSVELIERGAAPTTITGGEPRVPIGTPGAVAEPTVNLIGLTVTGGPNRSFPGAPSLDGNVHTEQAGDHRKGSGFPSWRLEGQLLGAVRP